MPRKLKWEYVTHKNFFPWLWSRIRARGRRIRSRIALLVFYRIWPMIIGMDVLKTPYGRLLARLSPHRNIDETDPAAIIDRIVRERASARHTMQRQQELIARQRETISILVGQTIDRLTAEVSATANRLEAKVEDRPTSWERLDDDDL